LNISSLDSFITYGRTLALSHPWLMAIIGGALIGCSSSLMLIFNGRITGLSGIMARSLTENFRRQTWRWAFLTGLLLGGLLLRLLLPIAFGESPPYAKSTFVLAGLLVGFGTRLGGGCTSGHGVCGMSRLSVRSIAATLTFVIIGMLAASLLRSSGVL
jgi:uncharacterized membrane protein YedE/YeeE